jgi:hypothetical protein
MARRIEVDIVGDATSLQRAFKETATGAQRFEAKITGSFHNIARSAVVTAGAFVGFSAIGDALKTSVSAAIDAQVSQKALATQMKTSGESFKANQAAIEQSGLALARYGFTIEDSQRALAVLDRATGSVTRSMQIQGIAANVAAATGRPLAQISLILGKAYDGQTASLKRLGVQIPKHVAGMQAMYIVAKKYAGQGLANTTVEKQFQVALHNSEVIIGTALLPTLNKYLGQLTTWLDKMNRSGRLQRDLNEAVRIGTDIVHGLSDALRTLNKVTGSTKTTVELLVAAFAAFKTAKVIGAIANVVTSITGIGTAAEESTGKVLALRGAILAIPALALTDIFLGKKALTQQATAGDVSGRGGSPYVKGTELDDIYQAARQGKVTGTLKLPGGATAPLTGLTGGLLVAQTAGYQAYLQQTMKRVFSGLGAGGTTAAAAATGGRGAPGLSAWQQLQIALAADPTSTRLLQQQATIDRQRIAFLRRLHAQGKGPQGQKYVDELTGFYNDLNSTLSTIASIQKKAADALKKHLHLPGAVSGAGTVAGLAGFARTETREFAAGLNAYLSGYGPITGWQAPMALQIAQARAGAFGTPAAQTSVLKRIRAAAEKALHSGRLVGQAWIDVYDAIANINQQLQQQAVGGATKFRHISRAVFTVGARTDAYAYGGARTVVIHNLNLHGIQDVAQLENALEARAKRRPQPRRGR